MGRWRMIRSGEVAGNMGSGARQAGGCAAAPARCPMGQAGGRRKNRRALMSAACLLNKPGISLPAACLQLRRPTLRMWGLLSTGANRCISRRRARQSMRKSLAPATGSKRNLESH
jgi:hypothetical protein